MTTTSIPDDRVAIDTPVRDGTVARVFRVSGWYSTPDGLPASRIHLEADGRKIASATRATRLDVAAAFTDKPRAATFGFYGDISLPPEMVGSTVEIAVVFETGGLKERQTVGHQHIGISSESPEPRRRAYDLQGLLSDDCREALHANHPDIYAPVVEGALHFHDADARPLIRLLEAGHTHAYPNESLALIENLEPGEVFLDLGCGIRPPDSFKANGVYLDAVHFPGVDLVSTRSSLPFADDSIGLVVSHAVFEHLSDPHGMAREIHRVLKPGGGVYVETAFLQPFHGDPDHYFNMTAPALKQVFDAFEIQSIHVAPHQGMSSGLIMQFEAVLPFLPACAWRYRLETWISLLKLEGRSLEAGLGELGGEIAAAGLAILARKRA